MHNHFLLVLCLTGCLWFSSSAWQVHMPRHIKALQGSCVVIPCSFDYHQYPPVRPTRVVWYQYVSRGYPLVYDDWYPNDVISKFKGKTHVLSNGKKCTLLINPVTWSHHKERIYPWVDPENVGSGTYKFYETTVTIEVVDSANKPDLMIKGDRKVGQSVTVQCSVIHTCSRYHPTLSLNIPHKNPSVVDSTQADGTSKRTLTMLMLVERDQQVVECTVKHNGGATEKTTQILNAKCSNSPLSITPTSEEFLEGVPSKVTCSVSYTCSQNMPTLTWNYPSMEASTDTSNIGTANWKTVSTLKFISSAKDNGKYLKCYAHFNRGERQEASIELRVKRNMLSRGWSFSAPSSVTGMAGSCVVVPCTFTYTQSRPANLKVIWYLYDKGYQPVYDGKQIVHSKYSSRTSLIGAENDGNCSLKIDRLEMLHSQDRVYPWVDENPIASYHTVEHSFYDKTTVIIVSDHAKEPQLTIIGNLNVEEQSRVSCSVQHTCISAPPTLTLAGVKGADETKHTMLSDGVWERRVERVWTVSENDQKVKCTVSYSGGQQATSETELNIECPYEDITMVEKPGNLTEGMATFVACSVSYKCKKNAPNIVWNFRNMPSTLDTKKISENAYKTISNLTFIGSLEDNKKPLTCTAHFSAGETSDSATLQITKYEQPEYTLEKDIFPADVPYRVSALSRSCVVIPCSYQSTEEMIFDRGIWSKKAGDVYHNARSNVLDHFKDRTRIVGNFNNGECSLEIDDIKPFDNGPFCFSAERGSSRYRFSNSCAFVLMKASPEKPVMTSIATEADAGSVLTVACSVTHTCPTHPPEFLWNVAKLTNEVTHTSTERGHWATTSKISFIVPDGDGPRNVTCTAKFWRNQQELSTVFVNIKGSWIYQMRIVAPVLAVVLLVFIPAIVFGVIVCKKRRKSNESLRPPPRPEKRRSLLDRFTSRKYQREARENPPRPEKRMSFWQRFSSQNTEIPSVVYMNNTANASCNLPISKSRYPSPKRDRRAHHP